MKLRTLVVVAMFVFALSALVPIGHAMNSDLQAQYVGSGGEFDGRIITDDAGSDPMEEPSEPEDADNTEVPPIQLQVPVSG